MAKKHASEYEWREKRMHEAIASNFGALFPDYYKVESKFNYTVGNKRKEIDIFAREKKSAKETWFPGHYTGGRPVIIELKKWAECPNKSLMKYAPDFGDPILVGVTELPLASKNMLEGVRYFFYWEGELIEYHKVVGFAVLYRCIYHEPIRGVYHLKRNMPGME